MSSSRERLLQQFRELVGERLEKVSRSLMKLESGPDVEAGKAALRELHGLKGEARMMGFPEVNSLVHEMEEVLRACEGFGFAIAPASADALLVTSDAVAVLAGTNAGAPPEVAKLLEWLKQRSAAEKAKAPEASDKIKAPAPSAPRAEGETEVPKAAREARLDGSVRISQQSLETLTSAVTGLLARSRRRELSAFRRFGITRELQQLHRMAEDLGPAAAALAARLGRTKDALSEQQRETRLLANEEMRDLTQISEEIQALRMMPLSVLFEAYPRMVRELARELGKEVELRVEGEDTLVDRSVLDALKDPLMHLVRNSLDHGLEDTGERVQNSKSPKGRLILHAEREGERLLLRVVDDGRGLDPNKLKAVAVKRGLLDEATAARLSEAAAFDLVFAAGFSSKEVVTDVSGRGVGLDVVRTRMVSLGGEVTVSSVLNRGATFDLRVPISLTVAPLLFVEVGDDRLCLTAVNVAKALKVEANQLRELAGKPALSVDDQLVPFASMASILGQAPERKASEGELVLMIQGRGQAAAVAVDRVLEERVQAVLPLKGMLSRYHHLAGATPLADGNLAMVLSAAHVVSTVQGQQVKLRSMAPAAAVSRKRKILVVDDSPLTRDLLCSLLETVGYEIVSAGDGAEALERLKTVSVDMVVTDLEMPKVDGLELTKRLKANATLRTLPVVIVTTRGSESDRRRGMESGADAYITKGDLVRQDLVDVVARLLS